MLYMHSLSLIFLCCCCATLLEVIEATSRAAALVIDFERSMAVTPAVQQPLDDTAAAAGPPRKRCRFVLLQAATNAVQQVRCTLVMSAVILTFSYSAYVPLLPTSMRHKQYSNLLHARAPAVQRGSEQAVVASILSI